MIVTVYTTPNCPQCRITKVALARSNVRYDSVDLAQHPRLAASLAAQGYASAPIVKVKSKRHGELTWTGFRPELIKQIDPTRPIKETS